MGPRVAWFVLAACVPALFLAGRLGDDLWEDEIFTIEAYLVGGLATVVADYTPNNHLGYSVPASAWLAVLGEPLTLRFAGWLLAVGTLWNVYRCGEQVGGTAPAILSTAVLGLLVMFQVHALQIRGYGLSMWLFSRLTFWALSTDVRRGWRHFAEVALGAAWLVLVLPTNALFVVPLALVRCFRSGRSGRVLLPWLVGMLVAAAAYLPFASQLLKAGQNQSSATWTDVAGLVQDVGWAVGQDLVWLLPLACVAAILQIKNGDLARARRQDAFTLMALVAGPLLLSRGLVSGLFVRVFCPILPAVALALGWSLAGALVWGERRMGERGSAGLRVLALVGIAGVLVPPLVAYPDRLDAERQVRIAQDGYFNYYSARYEPSAVADYLAEVAAAGEPYIVCNHDLDHLNVVYPLDRRGVRLFRAPRGNQGVRVYVVTPPRPDYAGIAATFPEVDLPAQQFERFPLVRDFGYYRVQRSPERVPLRRPLPGSNE